MNCFVLGYIFSLTKRMVIFLSTVVCITEYFASGAICQ